MTNEKRRALVYGPYVDLLQRAYRPQLAFASPAQTNEILEPTILIANHQCFADTPLILSSMQGSRIYTIAAEKLFKVPVLRKYLQALDTISVKQNSAQTAWFKAASQKIREGHSVLIFPEGRKNHDGEIGAFHSGFAMLAAATGAPVLPIYISEEYRAFHTPQRLIIGAPMRLSRPRLQRSYLKAETERAYQYMLELKAYAQETREEEPAWPLTLNPSCPQAIEEL